MEIEPSSRRGAMETVFYDGRCGLCHGFVRFVALRDGSEQFCFAPMGGQRFAAVVAEAERQRLPDSLVVRPATGELLVKSAAVLHVLERLGGMWKILAATISVVPRALRDGVYDGVARVRYRLFARPADVCPVVPAHLRSRFLS